MQSRSKTCSQCAYEIRAEAAEARRAERFGEVPAPPIMTFEPQAAPAEIWEGRPWNDDRNNYRMPNWNKGQPVRNLVQSPLRIAITDIETTDLWAGMGRVLCASTQFFGPDELITIRADSFPAWQSGKRSDDRDVVEAILKCLEAADIIYAYNGTGFDFPFLRTRALIHGLPPVEPRKIVDPVMLARKVFRFRSNRLDSVARDLGCPYEKTDVDKQVWARAMLDGDKECMDQIVHHCELDIKVLAWVAKKVSPYVRTIDQLGSFRQ